MDRALQSCSQQQPSERWIERKLREWMFWRGFGRWIGHSRSLPGEYHCKIECSYSNSRERDAGASHHGTKNFRLWIHIYLIGFLWRDCQICLWYTDNHSLRHGYRWTDRHIYSSKYRKREQCGQRRRRIHQFHRSGINGPLYFSIRRYAECEWTINLRTAIKEKSMRKLYICALVLAGAFLFVAPARAQFTTVTGNIDDPSGIPYAGGTISAQLVAGSSGPWRLSGQPYSGIVGSVTLDSTGSFSIRVGDNSLITPGGTQWVFTVRSAGATIQPPLGTGAQTFQTPPITITGATQNITANIDAVPVAALTNITVGSGTVTSITTSGPITGGPITTTGNLDCPTCVVNNLPNTGTAAMTLDMGLSLAFNPPQSSGCTPLAAGI